MRGRDDDDIFPKCGEHSPSQYLKQGMPLIDEQDQFTPDNWSYSNWKYSTGRMDEEMMKRYLHDASDLKTGTSLRGRPGLVEKGAKDAEICLAFNLKRDRIGRFVKLLSDTIGISFLARITLIVH